MSNQVISCPNCGVKIPLDKALTQQVENELKAKLKKQQDLYEKKLQAQEDDIQKKIELEKKKLWQIAQEKAKEKLDAQATKQLAQLQAELQVKVKQLKESEDNELALRKKARELEEKEKRIELEMARKLDEERKKIIDATKKQEEEQYRLKVMQKDKQMEILNKQISELKRKAEQGSQQIQGEVQEDDLKDILSSTFITDLITDIPTGAKGADLLQAVNSKLGKTVGKIVWESKNTKTFSEKWIAKLKSDQGLVSADLAILVTQVLPSDVRGFALKNGIWITDYTHFISLVSVLRLHLIEIFKVKQSLVSKDEKQELIYNYLSGAQFKNRVENIVMAFVNMKNDLDTEKRSLNRIWSKREKEIERVIMNTSSMYGDLQGFLGASLPDIQQLSLEGGQDEQ